MYNSEWTPDAETLSYLERLINEASAGNNDAMTNLFGEGGEQFRKSPDYYKYLAYLFKTSNNQKLRLVTGILIKNGIKSADRELDEGTYQYVRTIIHQSLSDDAYPIRNVAGTIIVSLLASKYEPLISGVTVILEYMDSRDGRLAEGAFNAICKICEDFANYIESSSKDLALKLITKLLYLLRNSTEMIRYKSLCALNNFVLINSKCVFNNIDEFLDVVLSLITDTSPSVKKALCQTILLIVETNPEKLLPKVTIVLEYMCHCLASDNEDLAMEACEFWLSYVECSDYHDHIETCLPQLVDALVNKMLYSEDFLANYESCNYDTNVEDQEKDIKPRHYASKTHTLGSDKNEKQRIAMGTTAIEASLDGQNDDYSYDDNDDDDIFSEWNIRKCASATLDILSTIYGNDLLIYLKPHIMNKLTNTEWIQQECGILILGAIADGCHSGLSPDYPNLLPYLISFLKHSHPLVRAITCWTLSKLIYWASFPIDTLFTDEKPPGEDQISEHIKLYFEPILYGVLEIVIDSNKHVQESACSFLAKIVESSRISVAPYLPQIFSTLNRAHLIYKAKCSAILYETISTIVETFRDELNNNPIYIQTIMAILYHGFHDLYESSTKTLSLLECISSVTFSLGSEFKNYAGDVWNKSLDILERMFHYIELEGTDKEVNLPYKDYIYVCLDICGNICQLMGPDAVNLISSSQRSIIGYMQFALTQTSDSILQSAFGLIGDISSTAYVHLKPYVGNLMEKIFKQLSDRSMPHVSTTSNAIWATGEIALKSQKEDFAYWIKPVSHELISILNDKEAVHMVKKNAAITIGRMSLAYPYEMCSYIPQYTVAWCDSFKKVEDSYERITAFEGICAVVKLNQVGIENYLKSLSEVVVEWDEMPTNLVEIYKNLISSYKSEIGTGIDEIISTWPQDIVQKLYQKCMF